MSTNINSDTNSTSDREIIISRVLNAPRELVFEAWTDPKHIIKWWGPKGFTNTFYEMDVRPGGVWRFMMHGPNGVDYPNKVVYLEVVKPERLVYDHGNDSEIDFRQFRVIITFENQGNKTLLTMRSIFKSKSEKDWVIERVGAIEGGNQTLDKLEEFLKQPHP